MPAAQSCLTPSPGITAEQSYVQACQSPSLCLCPIPPRGGLISLLASCQHSQEAVMGAGSA